MNWCNVHARCADIVVLWLGDVVERRLALVLWPSADFAPLPATRPASLHTQRQADCKRRGKYFYSFQFPTIRLCLGQEVQKELEQLPSMRGAELRGLRAGADGIPCCGFQALHRRPRGATWVLYIYRVPLRGRRWRQMKSTLLARNLV